MSWFARQSDAERAAGLAIGEAERIALPVATRSLTRVEMLGRQQGRSTLALIAFALLALILLLMLVMASATPGRGLAAWLIAVPAGGWAVWLIGRRRERRDAAYRDPGIAIEVREDGMTIAAPAGEERLSWGEVALEVLPVTYSKSTHFGGIRLETRFGPQQVDDVWYRDGRRAAAAIVGRVNASETARQRAKVARVC